MRFRLCESIEYDSEGNPLTEEQVRFFRNSKIKNRHGELLVCYHASESDFSIFDKNKVGTGNGGAHYGRGFYFTPHKDLASDYGRNIRKFYLNIKNPFEYYSSIEDIKKLFIDSGSKYDLSVLDDEKWEEFWDADTIDDIIAEVVGKKEDPYEVFTEMVKKAGYDGVIAGWDEIIAFEPNQIKSIDNKNPTSRDNINESVTAESDSNGDKLSQEQINFFKNSKVRDEQGRLLVCYHNSNSQFSVFDKNKVRSGTFGNGFYFSTSERNVRRYGGKYTESYYLNAHNILDLPIEYENIVDYVSKNYKEVDSHEEATKIIINKGYDAIRTEMQWEDDEFDYYVVFEPNQIKSVDNKSPTSSNNINENKK